MSARSSRASIPKVASRLGMEGLEVADPYVERLLEGFAFLTARVQLKLEAEHPRLIAHLLESMYPNFLAPVPSMMVLRLGVDVGRPQPGQGLHGAARQQRAVAAATRPGHTLRVPHRTRRDAVAGGAGVGAVLQLRARPAAGAPPPGGRRQGRPAHQAAHRRRLKFSELGLDRLRLYISAPGDIAFRLHELLLGMALGSWVVCDGASAARTLARRLQHRARRASAADEALLPETLRAFSGHRLLQEVSALPQRLLFFDVASLASRLSAVDSTEAELVILFSRGDPALESLVDGGSLALFCTPAVNLFVKRLDRVMLGPGSADHHLVPDRTRPMDFEVYAVETVQGFGSGREAQREFKPLYATQHGRSDNAHGYYSVRREARLWSERQRLQGPRSGYVGDEVYLSLVDAQHGAYREDLRQLAVTAWVSNRDLPLLLPRGAAGGGGGGSADTAAWRLESPGPVSRVEVLAGPTGPISRHPKGDVGWSLVNQLQLTHLSLTEGPSEQAAAGALRDTLRLYGPPQDDGWSTAARRHPQPRGQAHRAPPALCRAPELRPWAVDRARGRRAGLPGRQRLPARLRAGALLRTPCGHQQLHRAEPAHTAARAGQALGAAGRPTRNLVITP
jgi:type VI secretion system protein ImpG